MIVGVIVGGVIWGIVWGAVTQTIIENRGYAVNWFWWGFFFGFIAALVALSKPEYRPYAPASDSRISSAPLNKMRTPSDSALKGSRPVRSSTWKCSCGRVNPGYTGTCACGRTKMEQEKAAQEAYRLEQLTKLKEYKELLDAGVISPEEYADREKKLETGACTPALKGNPSAESSTWECLCGRVNPAYTGTCACGRTKAEQEKAAQEAYQEEIRLKQLKKLKKHKELLDAGVISPEEYATTKKELLG